MPNETEPTQMSPEQVASHAECKVWDNPTTVPGTDAALILEAILALGHMVNEQVIILAAAIDRQSRLLHDLLEGLKGGREVNAGRMSVMMGRIDVLEDTLRGKMELNQREVMTRLGVIENAAAQAVCRAWDRRPLTGGGGASGEGGGGGGSLVGTGGGSGGPAEQDYHDKAPGI